MYKIEKLTKEQELLLPEIREKWIKFALYSGDEIDIEAFKKGMSWVYAKAKLNDPIKIYVDSPLGIQYACKILKKIDFNKIKSVQVSAQVHIQVGEQVGDQVYDQVRNQVGDQVREQVGDQVYDQVRNQVRNQVSNQVSNQVRDQVSNQVRNQVRDQVSNQVSDQVRNQVREQVGNQVSDQVREQVGIQVYTQVYDQVREQVGNEYESFGYIGIGWDSYWLSFYNYFEQIGIKFNEEFKNYKDLIESGIYDTILFNNFAIACRRPKQVSRDEDNRMHSDNGPAIAWRDGFELYYLWGIHFKKELWEKVVSGKMTFSEIMALEDSDQRMVALRKNPEAIIKEGAECVDKSKRGNELWKIVGQQINKDLDFTKIWFLKMKCPTGRIFIEGVDPKVAEATQNADICQAYALGLTYEEYQTLKMET